VRIHGVVSEVPHPAAAVMKGGKDSHRDRGKDAEYFHPAGHAMGHCAPGGRAHFTIEVTL
jgi:hypothetical protein